MNCLHLHDMAPSFALRISKVRPTQGIARLWSSEALNEQYRGNFRPNELDGENNVGA